MTEESALIETSVKKAEKKPKKPSWTFTDDGCRWEVRLSLLVMLAAVFLWLFLSPPRSAPLYFIALPVFMVGVVIQAIQGRKQGRPGYPLKIGVILTAIGLLSIPGALYRETVDGPLGIQPMVLLMLFPGIWILGCWPFSRQRLIKARIRSHE